MRGTISMTFNKMKRLLTISGFIILSICLTSCKKENSKQEFVAGEVIFLVYDSVSFQSTYNLFDCLCLKIKAAYDFDYFTKTTTDSIDTIKIILNSKPYLTNGGWTYGALILNDTLHISTSFFDFDTNDGIDWFGTITQINLKEYLTGNFNKWGVINVPIGQEQLWVDKLKEYDIIESSQLNHIVYLND